MLAIFSYRFAEIIKSFVISAFGCYFQELNCGDRFVLVVEYDSIIFSSSLLKGELSLHV
ncbi:hypothetical protein PS718_03374 [Pseudomonas fluorescens]|uniref:Uncharacterized protein n=1 Tax=Pseudomonas fluorescens TaxID=294 RepID=A0A5E7CYZ5_PSEFL|nr:hypothetical protein PS718_03374 [Pseudomonas fluorescens]